jgi:hypothetical protein
LVGIVASVTGITVALAAQSQTATVDTHSKPAEQVYKDIQVLKGVPADQIMPTMQFMNIALGVQCEFCHLPGVYDAPNANKNAARTMMKMQFALIDGPFERVPALTCWTCHRGSRLPPTVPPVSLEATERTESPEKALRVTVTPSQVFQKWIDAAGGTDALSKATTRVETGTISFGSTQSPIEVLTKAPDKRMSVVHAADGDSVTAFDGHSGWMGTVGRTAHPMPPDENRGAMLDAIMTFPVTARKTFTQARMWRPEAINGHETNVIIFGETERPDVTLYFDKQSGLLLRMERYVLTPIGRIPTQIDYDDYRTESGVKLPFRWTVERPQGGFTIQIQRVQMNVPLDDSRFAEPQGLVAASQVALPPK